MSARREPPADVLLLRERRRRLGLEAATGAPPVAAGTDLILEADAIVADVSEPPQHGEGRIDLFRPLRALSLARVAWSGAIEHEALQNAIVCAAARYSDASRRLSWLGAVTTFALPEEPLDEPALTVSLGIDDAAALEHLGMRHPQGAALDIARAAALPVTIVGAGSATTDVAAPVLAAYRRASLVFAWQQALDGSASADATQERDACAVQVVSTLRALLGES